MGRWYQQTRLRAVARRSSSSCFCDLRQNQAPDTGLTLAEIVVDLVVTAMVMISMTLLVIMSIRVFSSQDEPERPERIAARELSRSAERMLVSERCANPPGEDLRSKCLTHVGVPFPLPHPHPDSSLQNNESVVCWMVQMQYDDSNRNSPDERDLECWYYLPCTPPLPVLPCSNNQLMRASYAPNGNTADQFVPSSWTSEPYRVTIITDRIERIEPWECVEGTHPDPDLPIITPRTSHCNGPGAWPNNNNTRVQSPGVAAVTVDLCVSLSAAELQRRSEPYGRTCTIKRVTVSPGRK